MIVIRLCVTTGRFHAHCLVSQGLLPFMGWSEVESDEPPAKDFPSGLGSDSRI